MTLCIKDIGFGDFLDEVAEQRQERCINREHDLVIVVTGMEGAGKSMFSLALGSIDPDFYKGFQVYFEWEKYLKIQNHFIKYLNKIVKTSPINHGSLLVYDEAGTQLHSRSSMANTDQVKMFIANRFLRLIHILNVPKLGSLDLYVREERINILVWIDYDMSKDERTAYIYGKKQLSRLFNIFYWKKLFSDTGWLIKTVTPDYRCRLPNLAKEFKNGKNWVPPEFILKYKEEKAKFNLKLTNSMIEDNEKKQEDN